MTNCNTPSIMKLHVYILYGEQISDFQLKRYFYNELTV